MQNCSDLFSEVQCPVLSTWLGLSLNTSQRSVDTFVGVTCAQGYSMEEQSSITIRCLTDGTWSSDVVCTGEACDELYVHVQQQSTDALWVLL